MSTINIKGFVSFCLVFLAICSESCTGKTSKADYLSLVESSNDLNLVRVFDDIEFKMMYRPDAYFKYKNGKEVDDKRGKADSEKTYSFILSIKDLKTHQEVLRRLTSDQNEYSQIVNYLSFEGEKDFRMLTGKDTLRCVFYHFERFNNISPIINFDIGFKHKNQSEDISIVYEDRMFGIGRIYFRFKKEQLDKIDQLVVE